MQGTETFEYTVLLIQPCEMDTVIILILQMRIQRGNVSKETQ